MKLPRLWLCRLIKDRLKKQRTAADRWWERWTNRWRKYKAQYWFLVSSEVRQDARSCLYMLCSAPDFFCPSLILADNASPSLCVCALLTLCIFSLRAPRENQGSEPNIIHPYVQSWNFIHINGLSPKSPINSTFSSLAGIRWSASLMIIDPSGCVGSWHRLPLSLVV